MKIRMLSRDAAQTTRPRSNDLPRLPRNLDPELHPFSQAREYTRALNATKLERVFAKPFVAALDGHRDGVYCMARHPNHLSAMISGSGDGELRVWNLINQKTVWSHTAHKGFVRGVCVANDGRSILSCGDDKAIRMWNFDYDNKNWATAVTEEAESVWLDDEGFTSIDYHRSDQLFATCNSSVQIWNYERSNPLFNLSWGADSLHCVRFNPTETHVLASAGSDRMIMLYDIRTKSPLTKLTLAMKTNAIAWNPMQAFNFTAANEDHNCYTFDMRNMSSALNILKDHVSAVMDIDYSPTGKEIVTGSYDCSIRLFRANEGHSRDIYHTRRMQRIFCVRFSQDNKYVVTGSDDTNLRLWKARAAEKLGPVSSRERAALNYADTLRGRFKHMPEVRRIARHRHIPKAIHTAARTKREMKEAIQRKEDNMRENSRSGSIPREAERKKNIVSQSR
ncbi:hypothetical protein H696_01803 [Fonticula alba]|uniref:DDB1- and CUL4-associated factor 13 n=1 Tax=Fonticula alba TaxID=691883 RepID=A0A058ZG10_FONAL|nr:hypothetical protein H696_01803 [Fonticula alba]KCV72407.1 hypothetical protein H696_01803 [Fonticula alba]|eukprot:XP_009493985.1 hypothetical protein H696_01803 [Fonticula alba]